MREETVATSAATKPAVSILRQTPVLRVLSGDTQQRLQEALRPIDLIKDQVLFRSGAPADACYLVEKGALKVAIEDHTGGETWLAILGAGDWVGELGIIDRQPRSATVIAMTDCRVWRLSVQDFDVMKRDDFQLYERLVQLICERLRVTNLQVCNQRLGLEARLAQTMLKLAKAFGEPTEDGQTLIRYRIGQSRLAEVASASRENVNRQFKAWREAGLCDRVQSYYCLSDLSDWELLAGQYPPTISG